MKLNIKSVIGLMLASMGASIFMNLLDPNDNLMVLKLSIAFMIGVFWPVPLLVADEKKDENEPPKA